MKKLLVVTLALLVSGCGVNDYKAQEGTVRSQRRDIPGYDLSKPTNMDVINNKSTLLDSSDIGRSNKPRINIPIVNLPNRLKE